MIWSLLANRWLLGGLVAAVVAAGGAWMAYSAGYEAGASTTMNSRHIPIAGINLPLSSAGCAAWGFFS